MAFRFDPSQKGFRKVLKEYQEHALRYVWERGEEGSTSGEVWEAVLDRLPEGESISRASVIFFLNDMVDERVLGYTEESGKGGYHRVYAPKMNEEEYVKYLVKTICKSMMKDFPEETMEIMSEILIK